MTPSLYPKWLLAVLVVLLLTGATALAFPGDEFRESWSASMPFTLAPGSSGHLRVTEVWGEGEGIRSDGLSVVRTGAPPAQLPWDREARTAVITLRLDRSPVPQAAPGILYEVTLPEAPSKEGSGTTQGAVAGPRASDPTTLARWDIREPGTTVVRLHNTGQTEAKGEMIVTFTSQHAVKPGLVVAMSALTLFGIGVAWPPLLGRPGSPGGPAKPF